MISPYVVDGSAIPEQLALYTFERMTADVQPDSNIYAKVPLDKLASMMGRAKLKDVMRFHNHGIPTERSEPYRSIDKLLPVFGCLY